MSEKQPKKKKTAGDVVLTVVLIAAICVFCYAGYNLFHIYTEYKKGTDIEQAATGAPLIQMEKQQGRRQAVN